MNGISVHRIARNTGIARDDIRVLLLSKNFVLVGRDADDNDTSHRNAWTKQTSDDQIKETAELLAMWR
jgi:hypothetical protein